MPGEKETLLQGIVGFYNGEKADIEKEKEKLERVKAAGEAEDAERIPFMEGTLNGREQVLSGLAAHLLVEGIRLEDEL